MKNFIFYVKIVCAIALLKQNFTPIYSVLFKYFITVIVETFIPLYGVTSTKILNKQKMK